MAYPILPEEAQKELDNVAAKFSLLIHTQQYTKAQRIITDLFKKMLSWQDEYGQRFHKGYPLHNIGYSLYLLNKHEEALKFFILAYIEDLISAENLDEADSTPAGQTLLIGYKLNPGLFKPLKQLVGELKKKKLYGCTLLKYYLNWKNQNQTTKRTLKQKKQNLRSAAIENSRYLVLSQGGRREYLLAGVEESLLLWMQ